MSSKEVPKTHPRYLSLMMREKIVAGVEKGITSPHGLIAHGRGEAFNYLIGEQTREFAIEAIGVAAAKLLLAKYPVISVNGNSAALVADEIIELSEILNAKIEINIFHTSGFREERIAEHLHESGAREVLLPEQDVVLSGIDSNRRFINSNGIEKADLVFVPLEDGDRCQALVQSGREVITVDLNPVSRTAVTSTVTIVDDLARAMKRLIENISELKSKGPDELKAYVNGFDNEQVLYKAKKFIAETFSGLN